MESSSNSTINLQKKIKESDIKLVQMLADELRPKDIAVKLKKSPRTVESMIEAAKKSYGCSGRAGLIVLFFRNGLIK